MPIPSSGAITADQIMAEFGGGRPFNISSYYAGGAFVPSGTQGIPSGSWVNIPTSGAISFANFRGAAKRVYYRVTGNQNLVVPVGCTLATGYLAGGGGGGGGGNDDPAHGRGGGGGAGALISFTNRGVSAGQTLGVIIGAGGRGGRTGYTVNDSGLNGGGSSFHGLSAIGGGGGGGSRSYGWGNNNNGVLSINIQMYGKSGACGGGHGGVRYGYSNMDTRNSGSVGGNGGLVPDGAGNGRGGGGGGMGGNGTNGGSGSSGAGGVGKWVSIPNSPLSGGVWLCGGGSGAYYGGTGATGGNGGGGKGGNTYTRGDNGAANTGGGGGGGGENQIGGDGGSGVLYVVFHR